MFGGDAASLVLILKFLNCLTGGLICKLDYDLVYGSLLVSELLMTFPGGFVAGCVSELIFLYIYIFIFIKLASGLISSLVSKL